MSTSQVVTFIWWSLAICLVVGETFNKAYRIPAGQNISFEQLKVGRIAQLADVFITDEVDFAYCRRYEMTRVDSIYVENLRESVESCLKEKTCSEVSWSPSDVAKVRCFGGFNVSYAQALNVVVTYNITEGVRFVKSSPSLSLAASGVNKSCTSGQVISLVDMVAVTIDRQLGSCSEQQSVRAARLVWDSLYACQPPCASIELSKSDDYGCRGVQGLVKYANFTTTTDINEVYIFYDCLDKAVVTTSHAPKSTRDPWTPIAIAFIILFCLVLIAVVVLFIRNRKASIEKKEEAKFAGLEGYRMRNNNDSGADNKGFDGPMKMGAMASPYAVQSLPSATRKPPSTVSVEPESYTYVDDQGVEMVGEGLAVPGVHESHRYEDLNAAVSTPIEEQYEDVTVRKDPTKPHMLQVDQPKNDRTSVASYIYFE